MSPDLTLLAVVWLSSAPQLWDRCLLLFTDPRRYGGQHPGAQEQQTQHLFIRTVRFKTIILFTALQLALLGGLWAITQAGIFGVTFPLFIMSLVPLRDYVIPRLFQEADLDELDSPEAVDEVATAAPQVDPPSMLAASAVAAPPASDSHSDTSSLRAGDDDGNGGSDDSDADDGEDETSVVRGSGAGAVRDDVDGGGDDDHFYTTGAFTGRAGHQLTRVATRRTAERRARRHDEAIAASAVTARHALRQRRRPPHEDPLPPSHHHHYDEEAPM